MLAGLIHLFAFLAGIFIWVISGKFVVNENSKKFLAFASIQFCIHIFI